MDLYYTYCFNLDPKKKDMVFYLFLGVLPPVILRGYNNTYVIASLQLHW